MLLLNPTANQTPYCALDGEAILDTKRICYDTQGRKFHNVDEADQFDRMATEDDESPYGEDIGMSGYKPWMGAQVHNESVSKEGF